MTATAVMIGPVPLLFKAGTGGEAQTPRATVQGRGRITATVPTFAVIPSIYTRFAVEQGKEAIRPHHHHGRSKRLELQSGRRMKKAVNTVNTMNPASECKGEI